MAKASDASTTDWIWLRDALTLVHEALGSREGAERQVRKWLAAKALPWSCKSWEGPESAREDSRFWGVSQINWEDNSVRGRTLAGTNAWGVEVSRTHLVELLSPWVREREETPEPPKPAEPKKMVPPKWLAWAREKYPQQRNERPTRYIRRLHGLMQKADNVTEVWGFETFKVRYYEAVRADR